MTNYSFNIDDLFDKYAALKRYYRTYGFKYGRRATDFAMAAVVSVIFLVCSLILFCTITSDFVATGLAVTSAVGILKLMIFLLLLSVVFSLAALYNWDKFNEIERPSVAAR